VTALSDSSDRYRLQLFALDRMLELPPAADPDQLLDAMRADVLANGLLTGSFHQQTKHGMATVLTLKLGGRTVVEPMYFVADFPEVFADACLRDSAAVLKFLSVYGRDGSIMQCEAALQLGHREGGVCRFHLVGPDGLRHAVEFGNADRLTKLSGRLPRQNLFGPLTQVWMYDKALVELDRAHRIGCAMHRLTREEPTSACAGQCHDGLLAKACP
jgi:hypothetical protein